MKPSSRKQIKIARIIDEYSVVINAGYNDGILQGDSFEIFAPGAEIKDPDTGESLGALDFVKAKIKARDVFPKMSVCQSQDYVSSLVAGFTAAMIGKSAELNVAVEDISGGFGDADPTIRVGDLVRKIEAKKSEVTESGAISPHSSSHS